MDCREFQRIHPELLDEALPAVDLVRVHRHMLECQACAGRDASIRRALLVFRNLQPIEPSREFSDRLNRKLVEARDGKKPNHLRLPVLSAFMAAAGLLLMVAVADRVRASQSRLSLPPVVATLPEPNTSPLVTPTIAASMSAGFPVWPALLMAEHASQQLADAEFRFASYTPRR